MGHAKGFLMSDASNKGEQQKEDPSNKTHTSIAEIAKNCIDASVSLIQKVLVSASTEQLLCASAFLETTLTSDYSESNHAGRLFALEHLCALALKNNKPVSGTEITSSELIEVSSSTRQQSMWVPVIATKTGDSLSDLVNSIILLHHTVIRCPTYLEHQEELNRKIVDHIRIPELTQRFGFSIDCCSLFFRKMRGAIEEKLRGLQPYCSVVYAELVKMMNGSDDKNSSESEPILPQELLDQFIRQVPVDIYMYTPEEMVELTGLERLVVDAILDNFTSYFGETREDYLYVSPVASLQRKPLIQFDEQRYFIGLLDYMPFAIRPRVEEELKSQPPTPLWTRYQNVRAEYLVNRTVQTFKTVAPSATSYTNLKYENPDRPGEETELDGLVKIDKTLLVIECKAGALADAAKRGAAKTLDKNINRLVGDATQQTDRAIRYLRSGEVTEFRTGKDKIEIDLKGVNEIIPVVVTLDHLDPVTSRLSMLRRLGRLDASGLELPWAINIVDLGILCEMVEWSSQLLHYLSRRIPVQAIEKIHFTEELDLFSVYLSNGLFFPDEILAKDNALLGLGNMTECFDEYYMGERLHGEKPASKPKMDIPPVVRRLMSEVEDSNSTGYSVINRYFLDLSGHARKQLEDTIMKLVALASQDRAPHDFSWETRDIAGLTIFLEPRKDEVLLRYQYLSNWCAMKKYRSKLPLWIGLLLFVDNGDFELAGFQCLSFVWKEDDELEEMCKAFESSSGQKIKSCLE